MMKYYSEINDKKSLPIRQFAKGIFVYKYFANITVVLVAKLFVFSKSFI